MFLLTLCSFCARQYGFYHRVLCLAGFPNYRAAHVASKGGRIQLLPCPAGNESRTYGHMHNKHQDSTWVICDGIDNDLNGVVDETTDLRSDLLNCGECGHVCPTPPQTSSELLVQHQLT